MKSSLPAALAVTLLISCSTNTQLDRGVGERGLKIVDYSTLEPNRAFEQATVDDLRWGASWLNRISNQQIHDAAIGSGFDEVRARIIVQKLHDRLASMNEHLR